jgi:hypothetical protein
MKTGVYATFEIKVVSGKKLTLLNEKNRILIYLVDTRPIFYMTLFIRA